MYSFYFLLEVQIGKKLNFAMTTNPFKKDELLPIAHKSDNFIDPKNV